MSSPLASDTIDAIKTAVETRFESQISFLREVVRAPSLRGEEAGVQTLVAEALAARGYEVETYKVDREALKTHPAYSPATINYADTFNVSGVKTPERQSGRSLILNAHVDVVPTADPAAWTHPPFSATRVGDWLYGRGAGDMKAGLVANLFALDAIEAAGFALQAPLEFQSVIDEETTGNGAAAAIARGTRADAVLIPEPTDEDIIFANAGVIKFRIEVQGVPAHPREPASGLSAIDAAILVIGALKELEARWNSEKTNHSGFETLTNPASLNIGTLQGGEWPSSIPFSCFLEGRIGFFPGDAASDRMAAVEEALAELVKREPRLEKANPRLEWNGTCQAGYRLDHGSDAENTLASAHRLVNGQDLGRSVMTCYLDAALFMNHCGIPSLTYGPVSKNIHGIDECVNLPSLKRVTQTIALFTAQWCGISAK
ncbi:ArgE/DapE family deacylase [Roseibium aggregatum]|uniref:ArgE/DapE family deacylase n=1 Tax=Roseibium aggregatum TaxID=187304 RepID=A0A939EB51_9HYPH|nr:ArgE/DapE family deacylase [Roseibium aggregatum]MBN9669382.1 ArgE/DapE family deacylase [Roseibium aggregatum]